MVHPENDLHYRLENLDYRLEFEAQLAAEMGRTTGSKIAPEQIIIDIPEPISFDIDLPVALADGKYLPFKDSGSVFDTKVVQGFSKTLRGLYLIGSPSESVADGFAKLGGRQILLKGL